MDHSIVVAVALFPFMGFLLWDFLADRPSKWNKYK